MRKFIVSTSIDKPSEAYKKYAQLKDWKLIIAGDLKTPHETYKGFNYLTPDYQAETYGDLSRYIGWNCIQRRNIAILEAYKQGAQIIALVDNDNIPYDGWGENLLLNHTVEVDYYTTEQQVFDPLSVTNYPHLWHRGFPIELAPDRKVCYSGKKTIKPLVQADLWDGDPDIDAICRMTYKPSVKFNIEKPYCGNKMSPFNSQNTFIHRSAVPYYFLFPFIGRMDDIWASYVIQHYFPNSVVYNKASVFQERNKHNLVKDLENEMFGLKMNMDLITNPECFENMLPEKSVIAWNEWRKYF